MSCPYELVCRDRMSGCILALECSDICASKERGMDKKDCSPTRISLSLCTKGAEICVPAFKAYCKELRDKIKTC